MKNTLFFLLIFMVSCSESNKTLELVATQHVSNGVTNNEPCKTLFRKDGQDVVKPINFKLKPHEAVIIAKEKLGYPCGHKFGLQIYADKKHYYLVQSGSKNNAIVIDGLNGTIISNGFRDKFK